MSDPSDALWSMAMLLDVSVADVRQTFRAARRAYPNESDEALLAITSETIRRQQQQRALAAARRSIGR